MSVKWEENAMINLDTWMWILLNDVRYYYIVICPVEGLDEVVHLKWNWNTPILHYAPQISIHLQHSQHKIFSPAVYICPYFSSQRKKKVSELNHYFWNPGGYYNNHQYWSYNISDIYLLRKWEESDSCIFFVSLKSYNLGGKVSCVPLERRFNC